MKDMKEKLLEANAVANSMMTVIIEQNKKDIAAHGNGVANAGLEVALIAIGGGLIGALKNEDKRFEMIVHFVTGMLLTMDHQVNFNSAKEIIDRAKASAGGTA